MLRAGAIILTFWAGVRLFFSPRTLARFASTFFSNPKAHSCRIHVSSERLERSPGARAFVSSVAGARTSEVSASDFGYVSLKSYCLLCREG
jgi:hypothetical protein